VVPGLSALTLRGIELVQGRGPACAARFGILLPPRGAAFAETVLGRPDPRPRRGQRRVVVGPLRGAHRGAGGAEVVQQPGPDGLGQFGIGIVRDTMPDVKIDVPAALFVISNAFIASLADVDGQESMLGGSVYTSRSARDRLRAQLKRFAYLVFNVAV